MTRGGTVRRLRSAARPLLAVYVLLVMYASLYPFSDWRWPPSAHLSDVLRLPWFPVRLHFDETMNLLGYVPLGLLLCATRARGGASAWGAALFAVTFCTLLSYLLEICQHFLPGRVPSLRDAVLNSAGAALGAALAMLMWRQGWLNRWGAWRERWFGAEGVGALVLLLLWPAALLFPAPVPLGLGQVFDEWPGLAEAWWRAPAGEVVVVTGSSAPWTVRLPPWQEGAAVSLGLLAPVLLAFAAVESPLRRLVAWAALSASGICITTLSTALNFGPSHALAWATGVTWVALGLASVGCLSLVAVPKRLAAGLALVASSALVTLVAQAPANPYFAASLQLWEQGQFIRFHGLAQWVGWLWPYAAMGWLLWRLGQRHQGS